jgi:hypothetical protein
MMKPNIGALHRTQTQNKSVSMHYAKEERDAGHMDMDDD